MIGGRAAGLFAVALALATAASLAPPTWIDAVSIDGSPIDPGRPRRTLRMAVWGMPFEDLLFRDRYARGFERLHPGLTIEYGRYQDLTDKYLAWHLLGEGADVMRLRITDYHGFVARGMLAPLDGFIEDPVIGLSPDDRADFTPAVWDLLEVDGRRYALPSDHAQYGLYYNKTLFDEHDARHPDAAIGYPSAEWTWADLRRAATKLAVGDSSGNPIRYGIDFDLWAWPYMAFLMQAGGRLWDDARTTTLIDSPEGLDALQLIVDLLPHGGSMRAVASVGSVSGPDKLFASGQTAMLLDGSWRAPDLERVNPGLDFAIARLPRHRRSAVVSGSVLWAVSAHSRDRETAWRMIQWMSGREASLLYWDALRVAPPARLSVMGSPGFRETSGLVDQDGTVHVPAMPASRFADRGAWLLEGVRPDPLTGAIPAFVPVAPYQPDLEDAITAMLKRAVDSGRTESLQILLGRAAHQVHQIIDRDRAAHGLPAVAR